MIVSDNFFVEAPLQVVWDYFMDIEKVSRCVPGVESVEEIDKNAYTGKLSVRVGPISTSFSGTIDITEVVPPNRLVANISGDDRASASAVKAIFASTLEEADGGTLVSYQVDLNLRGRLAQFGSVVVNATAKKMTAEFVNNLRAQIES